MEEDCDFPLQTVWQKGISGKVCIFESFMQFVRSDSVLNSQLCKLRRCVGNLEVSYAYLRKKGKRMENDCHFDAGWSDDSS
jgi:hypothetical protein